MRLFIMSGLLLMVPLGLANTPGDANTDVL
ncbi:hypothetical protein DEU29_10757 [Idiomarina aquatica]|jgi:hypothetical protein|uniref:Uncharacterized protein n=1 Tax=Idiomarina aquatica TaxID=1327752 RepID=A0A4R6P5V4_9GAMM|nr:hypothetical protein DEU29_10757 [Idiomarina aquatica]